MSTVPTITIDALLDRYDAILFDAYGVLVHGSGPLPGAGELLTRLNREGRPYFVVTNDASKLPATAASRYQRFGLPIDASRILTSGMLLAGHFAAAGLGGRRCAVLGPPDSMRYVADAGGDVVQPDEAFDVLVIGDESGFPFLDWADAALSSLFVSIDEGRPVHLVVPNPDLIYPGGGGFGFAAGHHRQHVRGRAGAALPGSDRTCASRGWASRTRRSSRTRSAALGTSRVVMVGDTLETDIAGARAAGLDAVWIETGVTSTIPESAPAHLRPTWRMAGLVPSVQESAP